MDKRSFRSSESPEPTYLDHETFDAQRRGVLSGLAAMLGLTLLGDTSKKKTPKTDKKPKKEPKKEPKKKTVPPPPTLGNAPGPGALIDDL